MTRTARLIVAAGATATVFGATAGDALASGYGAVAGQQSGGGSGGAGTLPFTGLNLLLYVVIAVAIVASGLALRAVAGRGSDL